MNYNEEYQKYNNEWQKVVQPHIDKFNIAAMFNQNVTFNTIGCKAMAILLQDMAQSLDSLNEIVRNGKKINNEKDSV